MLLATLPQDVLEGILARAPDFTSLRAAALTCKSIYNAYEAHPTGVTNAIVRNLVPSSAVLAAALRAIRVEQGVTLHGGDVKVILAAHNEARALATPLTSAECKMLEKRAGVCARIEALYSRTHKDRLSGTTSRLSQAESEAFNKAVHRIWLITSTIRFCHDNGIDTLNDFDNREASFYSDLSDQDLWHLDTLRRWWYEALQDEEDSMPVIVRYGPEGFMQRYEPDPTYYSDSLNDFEEFDDTWESDIQTVFRIRKVDLSDYPRTINGLQPLIQTVVGTGDECAVCHGRPGCALYNQNNWEYDTWVSQLHMPSFLFRDVGGNEHEYQLLDEYLFNPFRDYSQSVRVLPFIPPVRGLPSIPPVRVLRELFDLAAVVKSSRLKAHVLDDAFAGVTADDLLCQGCVTKLVSARIWIWWWNEKAHGRVIGEQLREDCWYGYECRTQSHNRSHARKLNHLCVNTDADRLAAKNAGQPPAADSAGLLPPDSASSGADMNANFCTST